ncbi:MAG: hypothetical protein ACM3KR_06175 [Deltaproteobacteria bacterium]
MIKRLKIRNMTKLIVFCLSMLLLVYSSKYIFGSSNDIRKTKDNLASNLFKTTNRMYIGGYYSQDNSKYINEFWAEYLQKEDEIWFYYNETSYNKGFEYIALDIKNKKNSKDTEDIRILCFKNFKISCVKGILEENIAVDWENNIIKIKKKALNQYNSGFYVRIGSAKTINSPIRMTSYKSCVP